MRKQKEGLAGDWNIILDLVGREGSFCGLRSCSPGSTLSVWLGDVTRGICSWGRQDGDLGARWRLGLWQHPSDASAEPPQLRDELRSPSLHPESRWEILSFCRKTLLRTPRLSQEQLI